MRACPLVLLSLALVGCGDRRSFDERYADTQHNLDARARNLEAAVNAADEGNSDGPGDRQNRGRR